MQNIPFFTTTFGVASLTLKEIPYKGTAYIRIQDSSEPKQLLKECVDFCLGAGAKHIYASGHAILEKYPLHTSIWRMVCARVNLPETDAALSPVQKNTLDRWRNIYNTRMKDIPNCSTMTVLDAQDMLKKGDGYFVYKGDILLGIGKASGCTVDAVISEIPGSGEDVLLALCSCLSGDWVSVEVASENTRAVRLYLRLGFLKTAELSRWYKII